MNLVAVLIIFNVLILVYLIIIEIFTTLCRITGMNAESAKFQVISLLTGTGFTTSESEVMLVTKKRRKLSQRIMIFSYIFNVSIVSVVVNTLMAILDTTATEIRLGILVTMWNLVLIYFINRSRVFKHIIDKIVMFVVNIKNHKHENFISVYDSYGSKVIAEIELTNLRKEFDMRTVEESNIKNTYSIQLLVIKRKDQIISEIFPNTMIKKGDTIVVFGKMRDIKNAFQRKQNIKLKEEN